MKNGPLFPHKTFLHQNAIEVSKLPDALQKRIYGFEELEQDLTTTIDDDREQLLSRMEDLSHELDEDLEEHFEEQIDNNDEQEEDEQEEDEHVANPASPGADEHECECKHAKPMTLESTEVQEMEPPLPSEPVKEIVPEVHPEPPKKEPTDEEILETLLESGWHKILPEDLRNKGFKAPLNFKVIAVGKFYLRKGRYETHYRILRAWD